MLLKAFDARSIDFRVAESTMLHSRSTGCAAMNAMPLSGQLRPKVRRTPGLTSRMQFLVNVPLLDKLKRPQQPQVPSDSACNPLGIFQEFARQVSCTARCIALPSIKLCNTEVSACIVGNVYRLSLECSANPSEKRAGLVAQNT